VFSNLNPHTILDQFPQFRIPGRYHDHVLPFIQDLADSQDYNFFIAVAPRTNAGATDPSRVAAFDSVEHEFNVVPGSLLWGLSSVSTPASGNDVGFRFEIWDQGRGEPISITKGTSGLMSGDVIMSPTAMARWTSFPTGANRRSVLPYIFLRPYVIVGTGLVAVKITNLVGVVNAIQLGIWIAQPKLPMSDKCVR
jgi:hypothetical protein